MKKYLGRIFGTSQIHLSLQWLRLLSQAVVLLLLFHCLLLLALLVGVLWLVFNFLSSTSSIAIILMGKSELMLLYFNCPPTSVMWLFLTVPWICQQCMIVVVPGHTHLPFDYSMFFKDVFLLETI